MLACTQSIETGRFISRLIIIKCCFVGQTTQTETTHTPCFLNFFFEYSTRWGISPTQAPVFSLYLERCLKSKNTNFLSENESGGTEWVLLGWEMDYTATYCRCTIWSKQFPNCNPYLLLFMTPAFLTLLWFAWPFWASLTDSDAPLLKWK